MDIPSVAQTYIPMSVVSCGWTISPKTFCWTLGTAIALWPYATTARLRGYECSTRGVSGILRKGGEGYSSRMEYWSSYFPAYHVFPPMYVPIRFLKIINKTKKYKVNLWCRHFALVLVECHSFPSSLPRTVRGWRENRNTEPITNYFLVSDSLCTNPKR